jgi:hypothetical protein
MERLAALFRSTDYRERGRKETAKLTMHKELPGIVKSVVKSLDMEENRIKRSFAACARREACMDDGIATHIPCR